DHGSRALDPFAGGGRELDPGAARDRDHVLERQRLPNLDWHRPKATVARPRRRTAPPPAPGPWVQSEGHARSVRRPRPRATAGPPARGPRRGRTGRPADRRGRRTGLRGRPAATTGHVRRRVAAPAARGPRRPPPATTRPTSPPRGERVPRVPARARPALSAVRRRPPVRVLVQDPRALSP